MTPEQLKSLFDGNAIMLIFAFGLIWKYVPALKAWANWLLPYVGVVGYILTRLVGGAVGDAHAAEAVADSVLVTTGTDKAIPNWLGVVIGGITSAVWARQLYEAFARALIERFFPGAAREASQNPKMRAHA